MGIISESGLLMDDQHHTIPVEGATTENIEQINRLLNRVGKEFNSERWYYPVTCEIGLNNEHKVTLAITKGHADGGDWANAIAASVVTAAKIAHPKTIATPPVAHFSYNHPKVVFDSLRDMQLALNTLAESKEEKVYFSGVTESAIER